MPDGSRHGGLPRQCSLPLACRHPPEGHQIGDRKRRTPENTILSQPYCRRVSTDRPNRESSQLIASLEGEPGPTPAGKTLPHSYPETITILFYWVVGRGETTSVAAASLARFGSNLAARQPGQGVRII